MQQEHEDRLVPQWAVLHHRRQERLFLSVAQVTRRTLHLRNKLDDPCRIAVKQSCLGCPRAVAFEADQDTVDRGGLHAAHRLQGAAVLRDERRGNLLRRKRHRRVVAVAPTGFTPGGKLAQLAQVAAAGAGAHVLLVREVAGIGSNGGLTGIGQCGLAGAPHR